jgi:hypothetical protein
LCSRCPAPKHSSLQRLGYYGTFGLTLACQLAVLLYILLWLRDEPREAREVHGEAREDHREVREESREASEESGEAREESREVREEPGEDRDVRPASGHSLLRVRAVLRDRPTVVLLGVMMLTVAAYSADLTYLYTRSLCQCSAGSATTG